MDEASGRIRPPPGFNREAFGTSGRPPFIRRYNQALTCFARSSIYNLADVYTSINTVQLM